MKINWSSLVCENVSSVAFLNFYCHLLIGLSLFSSYTTKGLVLLHVFVCVPNHYVSQKSTPLSCSMPPAHVLQVPYWFAHARWLLVVKTLTVIPGLLRWMQYTAMPRQPVSEYVPLSFHPDINKNNTTQITVKVLLLITIQNWTDCNLVNNPTFC